MESEGDEIKSKQGSKRDRTLLKRSSWKKSRLGLMFTYDMKL